MHHTHANDAAPAPQSATPEPVFTVLQEATPPSIPDGAHLVTALVEVPPGHPGSPPHRHGGPAFGYVLEGEMRLEIEGEPVRILRAGDAFWEAGGDVIHYQDGNNRTDSWSRFVVTLICAPGQPLLTPVDADELARREHLRAPRPS